jgi:RNA polymerase sigma-70 factor (ECF subfamily)
MGNLPGGGVYSIRPIRDGTRLMNPFGQEELSRLLDEHGRGLVLYARQWCDTPEDVVQDALLLLVRQVERPESVVAWLYQVVRNGAISALRSAGRRTRREAAVAHRAEVWFHPPQSDRLDAEEAAGALSRLPIEQRETIVSRLWGGLSFEQIAELSGCSTSSAHRWYQQGLAALRERLGEECPEKKTQQKKTFTT